MTTLTLLPQSLRKGEIREAGYISRSKNLRLLGVSLYSILFICVCICVCVCEREGGGEAWRICVYLCICVYLSVPLSDCQETATMLKCCKDFG